MAEQLKFFTVLSLKEMALRGVAAQLWSDPGVVASFSKLDVGEIDSKKRERIWLRSIEGKVKDKVLKLELPESLNKELIEVVRPIGLEIKRWKDYQERYLRIKCAEKISLTHSVKLFWTATGMIDWRRTAEDLVRCDALDIGYRYELACLNCLEDDIPLIWEKLSEESKRDYLCKGVPSQLLTKCWSYIIQGELSELDRLITPLNRNGNSFNQWAFQEAVMTGNKVATKFFFEKLTSEERKASLMRAVTIILKYTLRIFSQFLQSFRNENLSDVLCYLLTLLTPEQQLETIKTYPSTVLLAFFHCPCHDHFSENAALLWTCVPEGSYIKVQEEMSYLYQKPRLYIPNLLREFFKQSPTHFKKNCLSIGVGVAMLSEFLNLFILSDDSESLDVMFGSMDAVDRLKFFKYFFYDIFTRGHLVKVSLRRAVLTLKDKVQLKNVFDSLYKILGNEEGFDRNLKRCFKFLNGNNASADVGAKAKRCKLENSSPE